MSSIESVKLESSFSTRLREFYKLEKAPETLDEFAELWRMLFLQATRTPKGRQSLDAMVRGERIYGQCGTTTRHLVRLPGRAGVHVACALDALIEGFFQDVEIDSSCPHCQEAIVVKIVDHQTASAIPQSAVLWLGVSPRGEGPTIETVCPFINFFSSQNHLREWREKKPDQVGVLMSLSQAHDFIARALPLASAVQAESSSSQGATLSLEPF